MLALIFCATMLLLLGSPETPIAKILKRWLVDTPAGILSRLTPIRLGLALAVLGASILVVNLFAADGALLLGMALPEAMVWFIAFDVATMLDLLAAVAMVATGARFRGLRDQARLMAARLGLRVVSVVRRSGRARQGGRRARRPGGRSSKGNDEGGIGWGLAWA